MKMKFKVLRGCVIYDVFGGHILEKGDVVELEECNVKHLVHDGTLELHEEKKPSRKQKTED